MPGKIPVVDLRASDEGFDFENLCPEDKERIVKELTHAFSDIGFVYLKNHGIPQKQVDAAFDISKKYFKLPQDVKNKDRRIPPSYDGYCPPGSEPLDENKKFELRESYNFTFHDLLEHDDVPFSLPDCVPNFEAVFKELFNSLQKLTPVLLRIMAKGANLPDEEFFVNHHQRYVESGQYALRILYYPPFPDDVTSYDRLAAHSDYGSFTYLFQDTTGGLQIKNVDGEWIDAEPIPGTILINIADLIEMWTGGILKSTKHRVQVPESEEARKSSRYSMALFIAADADAWVEPVVGDKTKYKGIYVKDYIQGKVMENSNMNY